MQEQEFDLAVVGGGGAGVAAALKASEYGLRVAVFEKAGSIGGSSAMCKGIGALGTRQQIESGEAESAVADIMNEYMRQTSYLADNALIYHFLSNSGETLNWLQENGCAMEYVGTVQGAHKDSPFKTYFLWGPKKIREMRSIMDTVVSRGGMLMTGTAVTELIMEKGRIVGIRAFTNKGRHITVRAPAVLLCSGGYGNNEEMVLRATGGVKVNSINSGGQTGDGINMGLKAGAQPENISSMEYHGIDLPDDKVRNAGIAGAGGVLRKVSHFPCFLWVNHAAVRFANEEILFDTAYGGNTAFRQGNEFFAVMDSNIVQTLEERGYAALGAPVVDARMMPDTLWEGFEDVLEAGLESKLSYKSDSIHGLAGEIGLDLKRFAETVNVYNSFCGAGRDAMFSKARENLVPLSEPPFYAVELRAVQLCSLGGLRINLDMEVQSLENRSIPGLYAAGCDAAGGLFNNAYVSLEGMTLGWAFTSGRLAGESVVRYMSARNKG